MYSNFNFHDKQTERRERNNQRMQRRREKHRRARDRFDCIRIASLCARLLFNIQFFVVSLKFFVFALPFFSTSLIKLSGQMNLSSSGHFITCCFSLCRDIEHFRRIVTVSKCSRRLTVNIQPKSNKKIIFFSQRKFIHYYNKVMHNLLFFFSQNGYVISQTIFTIVLFLRSNKRQWMLISYTNTNISTFHK